MVQSDRPAQRSRLLAAMYEQADGSVDGIVDVYAAAALAGLGRAEANATIGYLQQDQLIVEGEVGGGYSLTSRGIRAVEEPRSVAHPSDLAINVLQNYGTIGNAALGSTATASMPSGQPNVDRSLKRRLLWPLLIGVAGSLIAATIWGAVADVGDDDKGRAGTTSATTGTPVSMTACGDSECAVLTVVDTIEYGRDDGVYVRACFTDEPCERRALAAAGDTVYGVCRIEGGSDVDGVSTWVRAPWRFVPGSVAADGTAIAAETGPSDPMSSDFGYVTARHLSPPAAIESLPVCD